MFKLLLMTMAVAGFSRCAVAAEEAAAPKEITAVFYNNAGDAVGKTIIKEGATGVLLQLNLENIPAGEHAMHFHEKGDCSPMETFEAAGAHLNPHKTSHGVMDAKGHHAGDMPNIFVPESKMLRADIINEKVSLSETSLLDTDGTALIIHASADDYVTQPSGNAGDRIACAQIGGKDNEWCHPFCRPSDRI